MRCSLAVGLEGKSFAVVAIDFGTSYSGYVFALQWRKEQSHTVQSHTEQIHSVYWGIEYGRTTPKTPTAILFNEQEQFSHFGYDAIMKYHTLSSSDARAWLYFNHFKMELYNRKKFTSEITLTASNGKTMPALKVFAESMRFMMNHALGTIGEASTATFSADDVSWVLTVPAIWDSGAKQFMRLAAKEAGLIKDVQSEKLVIALEPEAAAIWCKQLPWSEFQAEGEGANLFEDSPRIQYIVVDCGGGTVDMTVHEFQEDQSHKELHKASGGGWGGTMVDQNFSEFLRQIFHSGVWEEYAEKHPAEMQRMMYDFAHQKCLHKGEDVVIRCCHGLLKVAEKRRPIEEYFDNKEGVSWLNGLIMITHETMKSFYDDCLANILGALRNILDEAGSGNVKYIFLVGGFAASFILRDTICNEYGKNLRILCPRESQVAIMKGALLFGNDRIIVPGIVCGRTYGTSISNNVYSTYRDVRKKKKMPESEVFRKLVGVGETVPLYKDVNFTFFPHESEEVVFTFFISPDEDPQFTDEAGVKPIGSVCLPLLKQEESHQVNLIMRFGLSTIKVTVSAIATRETATVMLELLRK